MISTIADRRNRTAQALSAVLVAIALVVVARVLVVQLSAGYHDDPRNAFVQGVVEVDTPLPEVISADGVVLARSVRDRDRYRRVYSIESLAPLLGVVPHSGYPTGLELSLANGDLDGDVELFVDTRLQSAATAAAGSSAAVLILGTDGAVLAAVDASTTPVAPVEDIASGAWTPPAGPFRLYPKGSDSVVFDRPVAAGSTLKPFVIAGAVDAGVVDGDEVFPSRSGYAPPGGRRISNYAGSTCPAGDLVDGLARSCNSTAVEVSSRLGAAGLRAILTAYGFGTPTEGARPAAASIEALSEGWPTTVDEASLATIGQGEARVTLLGLGLAYAGLAEGTGPPAPRLTADDPVRRDDSPVSDDARAVVLDGMRAAATTGTAKALADLDVLAKTGTATRVDGGSSSDGWVAVLAPADDPQYVVVVRVDGDPESATGSDAVAVASAIVPTLLDHQRPEGR